MKNKSINSNRMPVYRDSGFFLKNVKNTKQAFSDELDHPRIPETYIYSRYRNPTVAAAENAIMQIEQSEWSLLTQSGMAAIDTALSVFHEANKDEKWLFFSEIYGGTNSYIDNVLIKHRGINIQRFYADDGKYDIEKYEQVLKTEKPTLVYFEAVSNPMLVVADARKIISLAKEYGAVVIVDNTFATPRLWKPLNDGADIVIHSATKYFAGHGNITAGVLSGNCPEIEKAAIEYRKFVGHLLSPDDAYRLSTQLKTFDIRFEQQCQNALKLAHTLTVHQKIEKVMYPGLLTHQTHELARELFQGKLYGAMITFELKGENFEEKAEKCHHLVSQLEQSIPLIPSLGDVDTTLLPVEAVWGAKYPNPGMIRLSVGIESYTIIEETILSALDAL